jgi:6-phospho-beta-glucosidase
MKQNLKLVIICGGSPYVPLFIENLVHLKNGVTITDIWLVDEEIRKEQLNTVYQFSKRMLENHKFSINLYQSDDQLDALKDADFVVSLFGLEKDVYDISEEKILYEHQMLSDDLYGIKSSFKALRLVPKMYHLIEQITEICEKAWLINIAQPMGIISEAIFRYAEIDQFIGISHISEDMSQCFSKLLDAKDNQLIVCAAGLSPMSFMTNVFQNQKDRLPELIDIAHREENFSFWSNTFLYDLGVFPSMDLRKVYYHEDVKNTFIKNHQKKQSKVYRDIDIQEKLLKSYQDKKTVECPQNLRDHELSMSFKKATKLIESMILDKRDYQVVNTINNGHIMDIEEGSAIEITARITKDGPMPVHISRLPNQIKGFLQHLKSFEQLLADAIYEKDLNKVSIALKSHPLMYNIRDIDHAFNTFKLVNEKALAYYTKGVAHEVI